MILLFALLACGEPARVGSPDRVPDGLDAVQNEMLLLEEAMHATVTGVAKGDVSGVPHAFHRVHQARDLTVKALEAGEWKPALHADQLSTFETMDAAFHAEIEKLVDAAAKGDVPTTARQAGVLLEQCNGCHTQFRAPPAVPASPAAPHGH